MSWSNLRLLGICGIWLAAQTGCGGNPEVVSNDHGVDGNGATSGTGGTGGTDSGLIIPTGGDNAGGDGNGQSAYVCGNGELEPGEFCDDGNTADGDGCSGDCKDVNLDYDCSVVGEKCVKVVICGDGVLQGEEQCDDERGRWRRLLRRVPHGRRRLGVRETWEALREGVRLRQRHTRAR